MEQCRLQQAANICQTPVWIIVNTFRKEFNKYVLANNDHNIQVLAGVPNAIMLSFITTKQLEIFGNNFCIKT